MMYGRSARRGGDLVLHRLRVVTNEYTHSGPRVVWMCGNGANHAELFETPPAGVRPCPNCDPHEEGVYFAERDGCIKIGWSGNPLRRANGLGATLLAVIPGDTRTERAIHLAFADARMEGEWFYATPALREFIARVPARAEASA